MKKVLYLISFVLFLSSFGFLYLTYLQNNKAQSYANVCDLVRKKIYLPEEQIKDWHQLCLYQSEEVRFNHTDSDLINSLNSYFELINVSHLKVYSSAENSLIWYGHAYGSGIETKYINEHLVVYHVAKGSAADLAGVHRGDIVISLNGVATNNYDVAIQVGELELKRKNKIIRVNLKETPYQINDDLELEVINNSIALIKVPSFKAEFFEKKWQYFLKKLRPYKKFIFDFRNNHGGNFVSGLRFLSPFICGTKEIGYFVKPRSNSQKQQTLGDHLNDETQIETIEKNDLVTLSTFNSEECLPGELIVLVDAGTSSVAELVAQALSDYVGAKIWGNPTAGKVLVGIWYPLNDFGQGVRISIPEAIYQTKRGKQIEGEGLKIQKLLEYKLDDLQRQKDTWIEESVTELDFY